ncbi:MAG: L-histidine N-alpha-methyltransferase [Glaciecola sp.]|jgi:L-histidine N-alpha-methyltransferase
MIEQFIKEVDAGLSSVPASLPSKYFYDQVGDDLFVKIMNMPEYYLTRAEHEIFKEQITSMVHDLEIEKGKYFELIELGAGDGTKTKELLKYLNENDYLFHYSPIDISENALDGLEQILQKELPQVKVKKKQGDYFEVLDDLSKSDHPKIILFLGSNIGNMSDEEASRFFKELAKSVNPKDKVLLGVDLIKDESIVLPAYNDKQGITRAFNLNLLERINRELGGEFSMANFRHVAEYTKEEGIAKSFLESTVDQEVRIKKLGKSYRFKKGEKIKTEISRKYNHEVLSGLVKGTKFKIKKELTDRQGLFADYILSYE